MNPIKMTICLSVWMLFAGIMFAAEAPVSEQTDAAQILMTDEAEFVELSLNPEDELLRLLEAEAKEQQAQKVQKTATQQETPKTPVPTAAASKPEVVAVQPVTVDAVSTAPVVAEPNNVETTESAPALVSSEEEDDFHDLRKKLMFGQMEPVDEMTPEEQADGLADLIQQLRALETPKKITPEETPAETESATLPQTPVPAEGTVTVTTQPSVQQQAAQPVQDAKNALLDRIENAENVREPLRLADVLYRQRYFQAALKYYQQALETFSAEDAANRQWVMFQMGNCARQIDEVKAIEIYSKLIAAYPNSKWTHIAMTRRSILQWSQNNEIQTLIAGDVQ
jgi:tetratricopeptide (TPR) repeat protein